MCAIKIPVLAIIAAGLAMLPGGRALAAGDAMAVAEAYNASGAALFQQLSGASGNIVLSPLSVGTAMAMTLSGARGETAREMASVLHQRLDRAAMEAGNAALAAALGRYDQSAVAPRCPQGLQADMRPSGARCRGAVPASGTCLYPATREGDACVAPGSFPPSARLLNADALMLSGRGDLVAPDYAALLKDQYGAEILRNASLDDVNGWVKRKTEGKIDRILGQIDHSVVAVILNAVYFKAKWAEVFAKNATKEVAFNLSPQRKVEVATMRLGARFAVVARPLYRALRLPYQIGQLGMIVVLPNEIGGLDEVGKRFEGNEWAKLATDLHAPDAIKSVDLALPRFKASYEASLVPRFQAAGMTLAFDLKRADFSGMTGKPPAQVPFAIGSIMHRAVVEVMEDGTEAAAATAVTVVTAAMPREQPPPPEPFHVDRPFLFAIIDDATGAVLFQGRVVDPRSPPP